MSEAAQRKDALSPAPARRWHNPIPMWICETPTYLELARRHPAYARVLQAICDVCDAPDDQGNLVGGFRSGKGFARLANVAVSTFWSAVRELVAHGFVVTLANGGTVRLAHKTINASSTYGVPGHQGALDHRAVKREFRLMQTDSAGRRRAVTVRAGDQATLWHRSVFSQQPADRGRPLSGQGVSGHRTGGVRSSDTTIALPFSDPAPLRNDHDHGASPDRLTRQRRRKMPNVAHATELMYWARNPFNPTQRCLQQLYAECCRLGLADASEAGALRFATAAVCALRQGRNPIRLFAAMVNSRQVLTGVELKVALQDEDAARAMLRGAPGPSPTHEHQAREFGE